MRQHQVALAFEDGVTRFISCTEDQTVADASYRSADQHPAGLPRRRLRHLQGVLRVRRIRRRHLHRRRAVPDEAAAGLRAALQHEAAIGSGAADRQHVGGRQDPGRDVRRHADRAQPALAHHRWRSPSRSRTATSWPSCRGSTSTSRSRAPTRAGPTRSAMRRTRSADLPGEADAGRGDVDVPHRARPGRRRADLHRSQRQSSSCARPSVRCCCSPAAPDWRRSCRSLRTLRAGTGRPAHLVYGVSTDEDLVELDTLERLAKEVEGLTWDHCVADPASSATNKGYVTSLIRPEHLYDGDVAVYLCGPPPMVEAVRKHFADAGIEPTGFYYEKFALSGDQFGRRTGRGARRAGGAHRTGARAGAPRCGGARRRVPMRKSTA